MIKNSIEDRRRNIRAQRILSIRHRLHKRGNQTFNPPWYVSLTENMSVNGILFNSAAPYQIDDIIELEVVLSGVLDIFSGYGKVVRVDKKDSGVVYSVAVMLIDLKNKGRRFKNIARENIQLQKSKKRIASARSKKSK